MAGMEVAVIGSGGREHVLAEALGESEIVDTVYCLNGNPGVDMLEKGVSVPICSGDIEGIVQFARQEQLDMVVVGPEAPLIAGLADALRANNIQTIGPSKKAAQLEGSKIFFQEFCERNDLPVVPALGIARAPHVAEEARAFVEKYDPSQYVAKADGEAGGKGAGVFDTREEYRAFVDMLLDGGFSDAAARGIVFQEKKPTEDPEVSDYSFWDRNGNFIELPAAQDHKRVGEGDTGLNGGGSGAYSPVPESLWTPARQKAKTENLETFSEASKREGLNYEGFLFEGWMGDWKLEDNVRFGDPEAQVVIPRLTRSGLDFAELMMAGAEGRLDQFVLPQLFGEHAMSFCLMAENYPETPVTGDEIMGLDREFGDDIRIYHGGTILGDDGKLYTKGGRVLYVTAFGANLVEARNKALGVIGQEDGGIYFRGMQFRRDIGERALRVA